MINPEKMMEYIEEYRSAIYDMYKADKVEWMVDHKKTLEEIIKGMQEILDESGVKVDLMDVFEEWEYNSGFHGEIYPCFDEWYDCFYG